MSEPADWKATALFGVGVTCQAGGRYEDAIDAYVQVLAQPGFGGHMPTLHNLAVSNIRAGRYDRAVEALIGLEERTRDIRDAKERERAWFKVVYNRALAEQYLALYAQALIHTKRLLRRLLSSNEAGATTPIELPALMLHASLMLRALDTGDPRAAAPPALVDAARTISGATTKAPTRAHLLDAVTRAQEQLPEIVAYVRAAPGGDDPRTRYNLLCFTVRLADRVPGEAKRLLTAARDDAARAFRDERLSAWAPKDPALAPIYKRRQWRGWLGLTS